MEGGGGGRGFFFNATAATEIYPLSLRDALPILVAQVLADARRVVYDRYAELFELGRRADTRKHQDMG